MGADEDRRFYEMQQAERYASEQARHQLELAHQTQREQERRAAEQRAQEQLIWQQDEQRRENDRARRAREEWNRRPSETSQVEGPVLPYAAPTTYASGAVASRRKPSAAGKILGVAVIGTIVAVAIASQPPPPPPPKPVPGEGEKPVAPSATAQPPEEAPATAPVVAPKPRAAEADEPKQEEETEKEQASAQEGETEPETSAEQRSNARVHRERGVTLFEARRYLESIPEFEEAYVAAPRPEYLYDIAQAYRLAGHREKAIEFYRGYLKNFPHAPNREEIRSKIDALETEGAGSEGGGEERPQL